jgi:hypothetical protein
MRTIFFVSLWLFLAEFAQATEQFVRVNHQNLKDRVLSEGCIIDSYTSIGRLYYLPAVNVDFKVDNVWYRSQFESEHNLLDDCKQATDRADKFPWPQEAADLGLSGDSIKNNDIESILDPITGAHLGWGRKIIKGVISPLSRQFFKGYVVLESVKVSMVPVGP